MQQLIERLIEENALCYKNGKLADYIPELANVNPATLGVSLVDTEGKTYSAGDYTSKFTMQSITKVITLMLALMEKGFAEVFNHVGMEPTGDPFNSIIRLETIKPAKPLNPMINAGAIATVSLLSGNGEERINKILELVRRMSGNSSIQFNEKVYRSELQTGDLNRSLAYFMRNYRVIKGDVAEHLDVYFKQSSIEVTVKDIAQMAAVMANDGIDLVTGERIIPKETVRIAKTFMVTCGMYNASGEFAINVGVPAKSGVGGGIMAVAPHKYGIGVVGPALDEKGNSIAGLKILQSLSKELNLSIF